MLLGGIFGFALSCFGAYHLYLACINRSVSLPSLLSSRPLTRPQNDNRSYGTQPFLPRRSELATR